MQEGDFMEKDLISVIVPVYKAETFLERCVNSITNQTYKNLEIILVDDGSPDNSPAICDELAKNDKRIKVIHKPNGGVSSARNEGISKANGKFVCFIDSDDIYDETFISKMLNTLKANGSDITFCLFDIIDEQSNMLKINELNIDSLKNNDISSFFYNARNGLNREDTMGSVCRIIAKYSLIRDLKFNTELSYCEDLVYILNIFEKNPKVSILHEYLYHYFCNSNSTFSTNPKYLINLSNTHAFLLTYLKTKNPELIKFINDDYIYKTITYLSHNKNFCKEIKKKIKQDSNFALCFNKENGRFFAKYHQSKKRKIFSKLTYNKHFFLLKLLYMIKK